MFATRSIGWRGSLSHDGYDNNVLRITGSVLPRIIDSAPIIAQGGFDAGRLRAQSETRKLAGPAMQTTAGHNSGLPATIADPAELRRRCRAGRFDGLTAGQAPGRVQANLMVVPRAQAYDMAVFCQRNPKPCPLLDITDPGDPEPRAIAPGADVRSDLPRYRVFRHGEMVDEPTDVTELWRDDLVAFLIGCSFTFEDALIGAGLPLRHIEEGVNVPMYRTGRACAAAGGFAGPMVVSMRPMTPAQAEAAIAVTRPYQRVHGAPVPRRRPGAARNCRSRPSRLRRQGDREARRDTGVLGLRGDAPGGGAERPPRDRHQPRAGPHVRLRPGQRDAAGLGHCTITFKQQR